MNRTFWKARLRALIVLGVLAGTGVGTTAAVADDGEPTDPVADSRIPVEIRNGTEWSEFCLHRAVLETAQGEPQRARDLLEQCDLTTAGSFSGADRAAFLLAYHYVEGKETYRLIELARQVASWEERTDYTRWIGVQLLLLGTREQSLPAPSLPVTITRVMTGDLARSLIGGEHRNLPRTGPLLASLLLAEGNAEAALRFLEQEPPRTATGLFVEALVREKMGQDASALWNRISVSKPAVPEEIDIVGLAGFRLTREAVLRGDDPGPFVNRIPETSLYLSHARHVLALYLVEHDQPEAAGELMDDLWNSPGYRDREQAGLFLAGELLETDRPEDAYALYGEVLEEWTRELEAVVARNTEEGRAELWTEWNRSGFWPHDLPLDMNAAWSARETAAEKARNLRSGENPEPWSEPGLPRVSAPAVLPPPPQERATLLELETAALYASRDWENARWRVQLLEEEQARRLRYQELGTARIDEELARLLPRTARLDSLAAHHDDLLARLENLKNRFENRFHRRTEELLARDRAQLNWLRALRRFHVEGPNPTVPAPPDEATPGSLIDEEELLGTSVENDLEGFKESVSSRLEASLSEVWAPRFGRNVDALGERARGLVAGLQDLRLRLQNAADSVRTDDNLARAREELRLLAAERDSSNLAYARERDRLARVQVERALEAIDRRREAVDYGLAASLYEWSSSDSLMALVDSSGGSSRDLRIECRERLAAFLRDYPESFARGETRFRLADMHLLAAREEFERKMESFLSGDGSKVNGVRAEVPFVDVEPALDLYRRILDEDPGYPHRDAVLFNLGMIQTDVGDARGVTHLATLLELHPDSPFIQEATLRLADDRFDVQDFAACVPLYEKAAAGEEPGLAAIALYRLGWAEFSRDRFEPAADAFRRLLDLYHHHTIDRTQATDRSTPWPIKTDLRDEAQDYLVHAMARAGGAKFFARYFEEIGPRSYEPAVLQGLAQLNREFSQYAAAVEADSMYIRRYPLDPMALASARRLVDSFDQSNHAADARRARAKYAEHFLPGSDWVRANPNLFAEASEFSRSAYQHLAIHHHRRAQKQKKPGEWQKALDLYETLLAHWAGHAEAPRYHLYAGESAAGLNRYPQALDHYQRAVASMEAAADTNRSLIVDIDWQRVAIADAWYGSTMTEGAAGDPAVAADLLKNAQMFMDRHPADERAAQAVWRKGSVAFAHEWYSQAAVDFGWLARYYPGDANAPRAGALRGDCFYRSKKFNLARDAYEDALVLIEDHGVDSLAKRIEPLVPLCAYRHAEFTAESDASHPEKAAALFSEVASTWPDYEHAGLSLYRAGLGYAEAGRAEEAAVSWKRLLAEHPDHEFARDAYLKTAEVWEKHDRPTEAAAAYRAFSEAYPKDASASGALLKSAELWASAGNGDEADAVRLDYIRRFPEDHETAMSILEELAGRDLDTVSEEKPVSSLLSAKKGDTPSHLASYLKLSGEHPDLANPEIQARVQFQLGEEAYADFTAVPITLPLEKSIAKKKERLEALLEHYGACGEFDVPRWARGATYRIGEALIHFGEALLDGERPADLSGEDLTAYEQVLEDEAWSFYDQGEAVWGELLRKTRDAEADPGDWITLTREALWPRLAEKFLFMPEVEYPLAAAERPAFDPTESEKMAQSEESAAEDEAAAAVH